MKCNEPLSVQMIALHMAESHKHNIEWTKASHIGAYVSLIFGSKAHNLLE